MPFISITRLRIRSLRFMPGFVLQTLGTVMQVKRAPGFRGGFLLPDRIWTFWTMTAWDDREAMQAYMTSGSHRAAMPSLLAWCDEASVVHWDQTDETLPSWPEADRRMRSSGRASKVRHPSPDHLALAFLPPPHATGTPIEPAALQRGLSGNSLRKCPSRGLAVSGLVPICRDLV